MTRASGFAPIIGVTVKPTALLAGVIALVFALGGCGGGDSPTLAGTGRAHEPGAAPVLHAPALFSIERRRGDAAIGETLTVAGDGSGTIVRAGGGGGRRTETCHFATPLMHWFRREAPPIPGPPTPKPRRVEKPAIYMLTRGGRHAVFIDGAIPASVQPFVARVKGVLSGRWGDCVTVRAQR
jgi:hypothetical protein